jgi:hypothetical protein
MRKLGRDYFDGNDEMYSEDMSTDEGALRRLPSRQQMLLLLFWEAATTEQKTRTANATAQQLANERPTTRTIIRRATARS